MELLNNLDKVHTTEMGVDRIKRNIGVDVEDIVEYCIDKIKQDNAVIERTYKLEQQVEDLEKRLK